MKYVKPLINQKDIDKYLKSLKTSSGAKFEALAVLGIETGLRISDLLKLKYGQFGASKRYLRIREQKTGKYRDILITPVMREAVLRLKKSGRHNNNTYMFTGREIDRPMDRTTAYRHLRRAGEDLGYKGFGTHSLRKTYAIRLFKDSGGDVEYVRAMLNHKYSDTTLKSYIMSGIDTGSILEIYSRGE